jgi:phosphatidylserine/phosphatidylglycerophosphate/cardiolipin synthase-like enzyme
MEDRVSPKRAMLNKSLHIPTEAALLSDGSSGGAKVAGLPAIEFVETAPIETTLDIPEIRDTYEVWMQMIKGARSTLDIEAFYFCSEAGEPLEDIIDTITDVSKRGAKVRIIADAKFHEIYPEPLDSLDKEKNISVRFIDMEKLSGGVMHAKYFVIDGRDVFLGSQNFDWRSLTHVHELGLRVTDRRFAAILADLFELDWKLAQAGDKETAAKLVKAREYKVPVKVSGLDGESTELTPVFSPLDWIPDRGLWTEDRLVELVDGAERDILIQVLSYSPVARDGSFYPRLDNALRTAANRGVAIKLIVADWSKTSPRVHHLKSLAVLPNVDVKFSTIPLWSKGYISFARVEHCKLLVVDSSAGWIGSSNLSKDYFHNSRNVGVIMKGKSVVSTLRKVFFTDWMGPYTYFVDPAADYIAPQVGD